MCFLEANLKMSHPDDEGFEALLKPIQDLTRNWEVDLCLHLEEYINYIRQICGDNIPDMNFAQAAVLVQNSANIYSKKVDFLFSTVLQLLDTLSKKQKEAKNREGQDDEPGQSGSRRRRAVVLETEEFISFDDVCSDRTLTLNLEKEKQKNAERKKPSIVLNAAIKVKAKEKTSCTVYNCASDIMGKKEEFRLNWRMCSKGTLHEEFVINKSRFDALEPVEFSVCANDVSLEDDNCSHHSVDSGVDHLPPSEDEPPPLNNSLFSALPTNIDRESEANRLGQVPVNKIDAGNVVDVNMIDWQPIDFNDNLPEKPIKKRKVTKIPPELDELKKRKHSIDDLKLSFTITDVFFSKFKNSTFNRDVDFCYQSKLAAQHKRQLLLNHRAKYHAYWEKETGLEQIGDFPGFYTGENDSDSEHDFGGFDNVQDEDAAACDVEVPLPDRATSLIIHGVEGGWKGDDANTYHNEAMKTLEAYRSRKIDHGRMSDMARRVEEWHKKILPKLEAAEQRSSFDIHAYGTKVLDAFSEEIGCVKPFEAIVAGQPREEVARYFLATLVLANQYNVEISETQEGDLNVDCVQLKLLSVVRHHEEMDENLRQTSDK